VTWIHNAENSSIMNMKTLPVIIRTIKTIGSITLSVIALTVCQMEVRAGVTLIHDAAAISKAMEGIQKSVPIAKADPSRPVYHMMPEAQRMNDPIGAFFADGWFHVFYQSNPYDTGWGHMHWGHARSRDNVIWERLPVAVWPTTEKGEDHCYSGSTVKDGYGNWRVEVFADGKTTVDVWPMKSIWPNP
jgi:hypothetical protein